MTCRGSSNDMTEQEVVHSFRIKWLLSITMKTLASITLLCNSYLNLWGALRNLRQTFG